MDNAPTAKTKGQRLKDAFKKANDAANRFTTNRYIAPLFTGSGLMSALTFYWLGGKDFIEKSLAPSLGPEAAFAVSAIAYLGVGYVGGYSLPRLGRKIKPYLKRKNKTAPQA